MSKSQDTNCEEWHNTPEPNAIELSGDIILDTQPELDYVYLWKSKNPSNSWLKYNGDLMPITK